MDSILQDLRYALRALRRNPVLFVVASLSLGVGIGPNSVLFSVIDGLGFRPLPVRDAGSLVQVSLRDRDGDDRGLSYVEYLEIREAAAGFAEMAVSAPLPAGISDTAQPPVVLVGATVSANYFPMLGVAPILGRTFRGDDDSRSASPVVMVSERLWDRRYGRSPGLLGQSIRLNRQPYTVIGVVPAAFAGTTAVLAPDFWVPVAVSPVSDPDRGGFTALGRLRAGTTLAQARGPLEAQAARLDARRKGEGAWRIVLDYEQSVRRRPFLLIGTLALAVIGLVLLIACANVAGLLLARSEARRGEIGIRLALGASRRRIVRQLLVESCLVSAGGAAVGLLLAFWLLGAMPALIPSLPLSLNFDFRLDARVLAVTLLVALLAVPLFGLGPALLAARPDLVSVLKGEADHRSRTRRLVLQNSLVVGQIAVAVVLLAASGLLVRTFLHARHIDPGFRQGPMLYCTIAPGAVGYSTEQVRDFFDRLLERLRALPGVEGATLARHMPLNALYGSGVPLRLEVPGFDPSPGEQPRVRSNIVDASFFTTMGTEIVRGRGFAAGDGRGAGSPVLVNQTMAARYWRGRDPIGQHFSLVENAGPPVRKRDCEVAGVVRDAKYISLTEAPQPYLYQPLGREYPGELTLIVRYAGDTAAMAAAFRREVHALDPAMPALEVVTLADHLRLAMVVERTLSALIGVLGGLGLLLSVVGLYGIVSYLVSRRTREVGIRVALGASPRRIVREVMSDGGRLAVWGAGIGVAAGLVIMRVAAGAFHGVSPNDPLVFATVVVVVLAVAGVASFVPARRAARVDPLTALRST